jgi:adenylate cyclase
MAGRHLKTLVAVVMSGLWGASVYFAHDRGHLGFLDLIESTMTDLRTLVRGVKSPPDFVTIVAIDDTMIKDGASYPLSRAEFARIVDAIVHWSRRSLGSIFCW